MVLILPLAQPTEGSKLIEVVSEAMREVEGEGWKFEKKRRMEYSKFWGCGDYGGARIHGYVLKQEKAEKFGENSLFHHHKHKITSNKILLSLNRKNESYNVAFGLISFVHFANVMTLGIPEILTRIKYGPYNLNANVKSCKDRIFTLLNPKEKYSELEFFANASESFKERDYFNVSGAVISVDSKQYQRIAPAFESLERKIIKRIPLPEHQGGYRIPALQH